MENVQTLYQLTNSKNAINIELASLYLAIMNSVETRQKIQHYLDQLSPERLMIAVDFLAYLAEREDNEATEELLNISGFKEAFQKAQDNVKQGKVISVDQLQRKY